MCVWLIHRVIIASDYLLKDIKYFALFEQLSRIIPIVCIVND